MAEFIYTMTKARKALGDKVILDDVTLSFCPGAKIGVVGPNGAGKSTILKIMAGLDQPVQRRGAADARATPSASCMQEPPLNEAKTVLGNVEEGVGEIKAQARPLQRDLRADGRARRRLRRAAGRDGRRCRRPSTHADAWDLDSQLEQAMDALRCPPPDADVTVLSGGERRRVALCKLLLEKPDLLLLDEPTNHLDAESRAVARAAPGAATPAPSWPSPTTGTSSTTSRSGSARSTAAASTRTRATTPPTWRRSASACEVQGKKDAKLAKRLKEELEWVRSNAKGRQTKSKARLARYEEMAAEADRTRKLDFEEIQIPPGPRLGCDRHRGQEPAEGLRRPGAHRRPVVHAAAQRHRRRHRPERRRQDHAVQDDRRPGAARTPATLKVGETVKISYVDQSRGGIDPKKTLWEVVSDGLDYIKVGNVEMPSRAYVAAFGFKGPDQQKPAGVLSGGERNRLNLALTLKQGGNLLLLDEPTNDLDVETLGSLENALLEFPGCAVVVSHDRWFLDRVATHILAYEGTEENPANWYWFEGNFESLRGEQGRAARRRRRPPAPGHLPQAHPRLRPRMSYDLTFLPKTDDQSWDEALDAAEQRVVASEESGAEDGRFDPQVWAALVAAARAELGEVHVFESPSHAEVSHHETGIQLSLFSDEAAITVPYWHEGERAAEVMAQVFRLAAVVERETGLHGFDPQSGLPLAEAAADSGLATATFDRVADSFRRHGDASARRCRRSC